MEYGERIGIKEISENINENEHTVAKLLQKLVRENIINSTKGPNGGFYITPKQKNQRILSIVTAIDGENVFNQCGLGLLKCSETRPCPIHNDFKIIREKFKTLCHEKRVYELYDDIKNGISYLS